MPALKKLLDLREELSDLRGKLQTNENLDEIIQATLGDEAKLAQLKEELASGEPGDDES